MNKTIKKIALILIVIILLPTLTYTAFEISTLNESEELIQNIYSSQLETILFSVNQYSEDVVNGWALRINGVLTRDVGKTDLINDLRRFIASNPSIKNVILTDSSYSEMLKIEIGSSDELVTDNVLDWSDPENTTERLLRYFDENYRKLEPVVINEEYKIIFITDNNLLNKNVCLIEPNPEIFIKQVLNSKIRSSARDEFSISVLKGGTNSPVFTTEVGPFTGFSVKRPLWLLPGYDLGITLKGATVQQLARERTVTTLIMISVLNVLLIGGLIIVFRNIKKEVELAQIKSDFVSNVSHELKTPLALISMFAETLEMGRVRSDEKRLEYYSIIHSETSRLSRIVSKILNFSQIEAGRRKYTYEKQNINDITRQIFDTYKFHLENNGFGFELILADNLPAVELDAEAVSEAIVNLIDNAMKYSKETKFITVSTGLDGKYVYIEVADKGIGIPDEHQSRIFEKFFRVSTGYIHNTKGTGLGLTLVKHIVDAHKGEIGLKSKTGRGSAFRLKFPLRKSDIISQINKNQHD